MKKRVIFLLSILAFIFMVAGCSKKKAVTPLDFLNTVVYRNHEDYIELSDSDEKIYVYEEIVESLKEIEYKKVKNINTSTRNFYWDKLLKYSMSGQISVSMKFYDNGYVHIRRTYALAKPGDFYYSLDKDKANEILSSLEQRVVELENSREEALALAKENGNIEKFFEYLPTCEDKDFRTGTGYKNGTDSFYSYLASIDYQYDSEIYNIMDHLDEESDYDLSYGYGENTILRCRFRISEKVTAYWHLEFSLDFNRIIVVYPFVDSYKNSYYLYIYYIIDDATSLELQQRIEALEKW